MPFITNAMVSLNDLGMEGKAEGGINTWHDWKEIKRANSDKTAAAIVNADI
jgi:NADH:ubiquinone oxidoreductase subunit F (NADH-binding)